MSSANPKAPLLKKDYFYGVSPFSESILHGTVPEEESLAIASQRVSTFVDCAPKALIFKLNISEALAVEHCRNRHQDAAKCEERSQGCQGQ